MCLLFSFQLLDKLWSQVSSLLPPGTCLPFLSRIGFTIPTVCQFHGMLLTPALALSASQFVHKNCHTVHLLCVHTVIDVRIIATVSSISRDNILVHREQADFSAVHTCTQRVVSHNDYYVLLLIDTPHDSTQTTRTHRTTHHTQQPQHTLPLHIILCAR